MSDRRSPRNRSSPRNEKRNTAREHSRINSESKNKDDMERKKIESPERRKNEIKKDHNIRTSPDRRGRGPDLREPRRGDLKRERLDSNEPFIKNKKKNRPSQGDESKMEWGKKPGESDSESIEKEKPDYKPSGLLNKSKDTIRDVETKYVESPDGAIPKLKWRLYPFKGEQKLETIPIFTKSYYLLGKDRKIVEISLDHPSCSRQHSVIQFRTVDVKDADNPNANAIRINKPYIMDLGSTNGTYLNGSKIDPLRYVELLERDILKFGNSSREYVLLHEGTS